MEFLEKGDWGHKIPGKRGLGTPQRTQKTWEKGLGTFRIARELWNSWEKGLGGTKNLEKETGVPPGFLISISRDRNNLEKGTWNPKGTRNSWERGLKTPKRTQTSWTQMLETPKSSWKWGRGGRFLVQPPGSAGRLQGACADSKICFSRYLMESGWLNQLKPTLASTWSRENSFHPYFRNKPYFWGCFLVSLFQKTKRGITHHAALAPDAGQRM